MPLATTSIPTPNGSVELQLERGQSVLFLGANGGGKTRLGVHLDTQLTRKSHRIAAQRALQFSASVQLVDFDTALEKLQYGASRSVNTHLQGDLLFQHKQMNRYGNKPVTFLLSDYETLLQALFGEETRKSVKFRQAIKQGETVEVPETCFDRLQVIWSSMLPHRNLVVLDATVKVDTTDGVASRYDATELSDGERVIFYLIGQTLMLPSECVLIIDEPELHVHRALLTKLWDALESARSDCAFIYITHDLEFAASRLAAQKFALHGYSAEPAPRWDIEALPTDIVGIPEEIVCRIVGSRQPILFVEGDSGSEDISLYRRVYPLHTVIPVGSCDAVISSVGAFRAHKRLHRVSCCGIVDADHRTPSEIASLQAMNVFATPVAEIENLFVLPDVFSALAQTLGYAPAPAADLARQLGERILATAGRDVATFALRYSKRRIDRSLKSIGLVSKNAADLSVEFASRIGAIDPARLHADASQRLAASVENRNVEEVLEIYDNKGLLGQAATLFGMASKGLQEYIGRMLRSPQGQVFQDAVRAKLPTLNAAPITTTAPEIATVAQ
jgi:energy-coupling factor transporter ATP-binding protein EcfA2